MTIRQSQKDARNILVLGAGGMLGNAIFRFFSEDKRFVTVGTLRSESKRHHFSADQKQNLIGHINMDSDSDLITLFADVKPDIIINCVGVIKQLDDAKNHLTSIAVNSLLPHRLGRYAQLTDARLIHFSTDCVFSGRGGNYTEDDFPDANDLYGRSKFLGEVAGPNAVTLRTSIIGHELSSSLSLVDWFLAQDKQIKGYQKSIFSGLPAIEIARVIRDFVIPNKNLGGLHQLSVDPINKFNLLNLIAKVYGKKISIIADETLVIDRSLNSDKFRKLTGFTPKPWEELITDMHQGYQRYHK